MQTHTLVELTDVNYFVPHYFSLGQKNMELFFCRFKFFKALSLH